MNFITGQNHCTIQFDTACDPPSAIYIHKSYLNMFKALYLEEMLDEFGFNTIAM